MLVDKQGIPSFDVLALFDYNLWSHSDKRIGRQSIFRARLYNRFLQKSLALQVNVQAFT